MDRSVTKPSQRVKLEVEDVPCGQTTLREGQKRRREVFDCVLVSTSRSLKRVKAENDGEPVVNADTVASPVSMPRFEHSDPKDFEKTLKLWENVRSTFPLRFYKNLQLFLVQNQEEKEQPRATSRNH